MHELDLWLRIMRAVDRWGRFWEQQFRALRDGDRFYYENTGVFSSELRSAIARLERLFSGSGSVLKGVLLRNTNIAAGDIPNRVFLV